MADDDWKEDYEFSEEFNILVNNEPFLEYYDDPNVYYYYGVMNDLEYEDLENWFLDAEDAFAGYENDFDPVYAEQPYTIYRNYIYYGLY